MLVNLILVIIVCCFEINFFIINLVAKTSKTMKYKHFQIYYHFQNRLTLNLNKKEFSMIVAKLAT